MRAVTVEWSNLVRHLPLLAATVATVAAGQNRTGWDRFSVAVDLPPDRIELHRFRLEDSPQSLRVGFILGWVSRDGLWVGGREAGNVFHRRPLCLYVQNVKTAEKRSYCGLIEEARRFAFSDDLQRLAVLGRPHQEAGAQDTMGLFVIDLAHPARGPAFVLRNLENAYISGVSFTHDGNLLTFARENDIFAYDTQSGELRALGSGTQPTMSPSGSHLCFQDSSRRLILREIKSGIVSLIGETIGEAATWSPDGRGILYCRPYKDAEGNNAEVVVYVLATNTTEVLGKIYTLGDQYWWIVR